MGDFVLLGPELLANPGFESADVGSWYDYNGSFWAEDQAPIGYGSTKNGIFFTDEPGTPPAGEYRFLRQDIITNPQSGANFFLSGAISVGSSSVGSYGFDVNHSLLPNAGSRGTLLSESKYHEALDTLGSEYEFFGYDFATETGSAMYLRVEIPESKIGDDSESYHDDYSLRHRVVLNPGLDYGEAKSLTRFHNRTKSGALHTYTGPGSRRRFKIPLTWISSKDAADISSWWSVGANLRFNVDDDYPGSYHSVRITGKTNPFPTYQRPSKVHRTGVIILETL